MSTETQHSPALGSDEEHKKTERKRLGTKAIATLSTAAVALTAAAVVMFRPKEEGERTVTTPVVATSSPNPDQAVGPIPTQSPEGPNAPGINTATTTPETAISSAPSPTASETTTDKTTSSIAEGLTPTPEMYDPAVMQELVMDQTELDAFLRKFGEKYPDIPSQFKAEASRQRGVLELLKPEQLVRAQQRFNDTFAAQTWTDESIDAKDPELITLGGYLSKKYGSDSQFPQGVLPPKSIEEYSKAVPGNPPVEGITSTIARRIDEATRMTSELTWAVKNETAVNRYIHTMPEDQKPSVKLPSSSAEQIYLSLSMNLPSSTSTRAALEAAKDPNRQYAGCTDGVVVSSINKKVAYGSSEIPLQGLILACAQPEADQAVLYSVALLPVDSYKDGTKNGQVLQPVVVSATTYPGL